MTATQSRRPTAMAPSIYEDITLPGRTFFDINGTHLMAAVARGQMTPLHAVLLTNPVTSSGSMAEYAKAVDLFSFSRAIRETGEILRMDESHKNATMVLFEHGGQVLSYRQLPPEMHILPTLHPEIFKQKFLQLAAEDRRRWVHMGSGLFWMRQMELYGAYMYVQIGDEIWCRTVEREDSASDFALRRMMHHCLRATREVVSEYDFPPSQNDVPELRAAELLGARVEKVKAQQRVQSLQNQRIDIAKQLSAAQTRLATAATRLHQLEGR